MFHDIAQKLVLESIERDAEIDDCHFDVHLGKVVWVGHLCGHVEEELGVHVEFLVAYFYYWAALLDYYLLL
jgi:hypothetical protein